MEINHVREVSFSFQGLLSKLPINLKKFSSLDEATKANEAVSFQLGELINELTRSSTIYAFKDNFKKIRNLLKQNEKQLENKTIIEYLAYLNKLIAYECFFGEFKEIKGTTTDFIVELTAYPWIKAEVISL